MNELLAVTDEEATRLEAAVNSFSAKCYLNSEAHGFWEGNNDNPSSKIALMHSELSEALEFIRKGMDTPTDKPLEILGIEEELADEIIRVLDFAKRYGLNVGRALALKHNYNVGRPYKHGNKAF